MSEPWGGAGGWAAEAERAETEKREAAAVAPASRSQNFPSLKEAVNTKPRKKKKSLLKFNSISSARGGGIATKYKGLTPDEKLRLPPGLKERSADEMYSHGFSSFGRSGPPQGRMRDRDDNDGSWGGRRRSHGGFHEERRGPPSRVSDYDQPSRADEVDNWASVKKSLPSFDSGRQNRYGSLGGGSSADGKYNWSVGKKPLPTGSSAFGSEFRDSGVEAGRWARGPSRARERERPRLILDPPKGDAPVNEPVRTNKPNPFGAARPREEVLAEKGVDWKKVDSEIEAKKISRLSSSHSIRASIAQSSRSEQETETVVKPNPFGDARPREVVLEERGNDWRKIELELEHRGVDSNSKAEADADDEFPEELLEHFDDFTLASSWERFIAQIEAVCRLWMADGPKNLLEKGAVLLDCFDNLYKVKSEMNYAMKSYCLEYYFESKPDGKAAEWNFNLHNLQLCFGVKEFLVIAPQSASGVVLDAPEASNLLSAIAIAISNCSSLWPAFVPVHDPSRKAYIGIQNMGTVFTRRFEADRIDSQVPVKLMHLEGLYELFVAKFTGITKSEENPHGESSNRTQWDDDCSWSEWYSAEDPVRGFELIAIWSEKLVESSMEMAELENASPHEAEKWFISPSFSPNLLEGSKGNQIEFSSQLRLLIDALEMSFEAQVLKDFVSVENRGSDKSKSSMVIPSQTVIDRVMKELFHEGAQRSDFFYGEHKTYRATKGAPLESLFAQFCLHSLWFGNCNIRAITVLWIEFVREVRWCWEKSQPLPRMPANGIIDLSTCLINQKLQMLAICIEKKQRLIDMLAFKAANPDAVFEDFIRWHSPGDWEEDDLEDGVSSSGVGIEKSKDNWPPRGRLSKRMSEQGNLWRKIWNSASPLPASEQKLLLDPNGDGEKVLHYLETLWPHQLLEQMVCTAFGAAADTLNRTSYGELKQMVTKMDQLFLTLASGLKPLQVNRLSADSETINDLRRLCIVFEHVEKLLTVAASLHRKLLRAPRLSQEIFGDFYNFYIPRMGTGLTEDIINKEYNKKLELRNHERAVVSIMFSPSTANQSWRKVLSRGNLLFGHEPVLREIIFTLCDEVKGNHYATRDPTASQNELKSYRMYICRTSNDLRVALSVVSSD